MHSAKLRQKPSEYLCGTALWHPQWLQKFATTKTFMVVYGLLGTIQAMSYMYFIVTLTTLEKRFKMPSQTTGIILSGNEISQILLSLILSYIGGQRNRPRWIAWGIVFCGLSCYIVALPHFIYGAGDEALQWTEEFQTPSMEENLNGTFSLVHSNVTHNQRLCGAETDDDNCEDTLVSLIPLILIFLSQFVLGIGNTLYYSLGQTYLDDNTKKTNTPLMLAVAMALRMIGPIVGFFLGYVSLNMFIDPRKTPLIDNKDPRWLGAWWFGWMILGSLMVLFSGLIGLFPKQLPKKQDPSKYNSHMPQVLRHDEFRLDEGLPLGRGFSSNIALDAPSAAPPSDFPTLKDFPKALMRLLRNRLLIYNIISGIFYVLGAAGYMTFLTKYMEVQFHKNAQSGTIVVGPVSIIGMVIGLLGSGLVISKKKPSPSKVLLWNVVVGCVYMLGQVSYLFMYCPDTVNILEGGKLNLSKSCNANCSCDGVPYSPVCYEPTETTFFSACHAGCATWDSEQKIYSNCSCVPFDITTTTFLTTSIDPTTPLPTTKPSFTKIFQNLIPSSSEVPSTNLEPSSTTIAQLRKLTTDLPLATADLYGLEDLIGTTSPYLDKDSSTDSLLLRSRRSTELLTDVIKPGVCLKGCQTAFWTFSIASMIVNWFGSSGRIGNILVNYRAVSTEDKSFAQGLSLMLVSLFALIPGPIIFGRLIDASCLIWTKTCSGTGNCQLYDQTKFRYLVNTMACCLTAIGVLFDVLVWYYGRNLDLYGERETQRYEEEQRKKNAITPLLARVNAGTNKVNEFE